MTRILLHGAGRMARRVLALIREAENLECVGLVSINRPDDFSEINWRPSLEETDTPADLLIDFTLPGGTSAAAHWCARHQVAMLSGTTGLSEQDDEALRDAALKVPVLWAPNLSRGVALTTELVRRAAEALGSEVPAAIADIHHQHKLDAPSGTALALGAAVKQGFHQSVADASTTGNAEPEYSSVREGEVIGEHTVSFAMPDERIEITHKALDRDVFARGALQAGEWLVRQRPGFYSTGDWLALN